LQVVLRPRADPAGLSGRPVAFEQVLDAPNQDAEAGKGGTVCATVRGRHGELSGRDRNCNRG